jgi:hypothetical protein
MEKTIDIATTLDNRCVVGYHLKDGAAQGMSKSFI